VRAGLAAQGEEFLWSSARPHCGLRRDPVLAPDLPLLDEVPDWRDWLRVEDEPGQLGKLRHCTMRCQPCGSAEFGEEYRRRQTDPEGKR